LSERARTSDDIQIAIEERRRTVSRMPSSIDRANEWCSRWRAIAVLSRSSTHASALDDLPQQRGVVIQLRTELTEELPQIMGRKWSCASPHQSHFNAVDAMPMAAVSPCAPALTSGSRALTMSRAMCSWSRRYRHRHGRGDPAARLEPFYTTKGERARAWAGDVYGM